MKQEKLFLANPKAIFSIFFTTAGLFLLVSSLPSSPFIPDPQIYVFPVFSIATTCLSPVEMVIKLKVY